MLTNCHLLSSDEPEPKLSVEDSDYNCVSAPGTSNIGSKFFT